MGRLVGVRSSRTFARALRRRTSWGVGPKGALTFSTSNPVAAFGSTAVALSDGLTIVRIRGELLMYLTVADAINAGYDEVAVGICVVSENAAGVGITAVPTPITDVAWDGWMWMWQGSMKAAVANEFDRGQTSSVRAIVDTKAMRKIKETDVIVAVAEAGAEATNASLSLRFNSRTLVKLP